ncbi:MAG: hypothetical protein WCI03_15080 [bacterium]
MKTTLTRALSLMMAMISVPILYASDWTEVSRNAERAGLSSEQVEPFVQKARTAGYTADQAAQVLQPALQACKQGLPARSILDKIQEGLVKRVPAETLAQACHKRYRHLERATSLANTTGQPSGGVIYSATLALESGMSEQTLEKVLTESRGRRPGQVQAVIEAGESMMLNGMNENAVSTLMIDCLQRNLRRSEVLRTVRYSCQQHRSGMNGDTIRQSLWGQGQCDGTGNGQRLRDGSGGRQRQAMGP